MIQNHLLAAAVHRGDGAAGELRGRGSAQPQGGRAARHAPLHARNRARAQAVRGQYGAGWMEGKEVPGYRQEPDANPNSNTETFAAVKFFVDNWRWQGVPFYLRTGKRLHRSASVITIQFKDVPHFIFSARNGGDYAAEPPHYQHSARDEHSAASAGQAPRRGHDAEHRGHGIRLPAAPT